MNPHILIIGAGFAGVWSALSAARLLDQAQRGDVSISVLAPQAELRIRPRFYESDVHSMKAPLGALFETVGVTFIKGTPRPSMWKVAPSATPTPTASRGKSVTTAWCSPPEARWPAHRSRAWPSTPSMSIRWNRPCAGAAPVGLTKQPASPARDTVVVCGGGFTGIETATEMPTRLRTILGEDAPVRVVVVDRGPSIGAALGAGITPSIVEACEQAGVQWLTGRSVVAVDAGGVTLDDGEYIASKTVIWTVGVKASPLTAQVPGERDGFGRLRVDDHLKVIGQEHIYATGDVAWAAVDESGNHALMTCQHAIPMGRHCGNNAAADLLVVAPVVYRQPVYVTCLDLGGWGATFSEGWERTLKYKGQEGKDLKRQINTVWIYPPAADRAVALAAADPLIPVV